MNCNAAHLSSLFPRSSLLVFRPRSNLPLRSRTLLDIARILRQPMEFFPRSKFDVPLSRSRWTKTFVTRRLFETNLLKSVKYIWFLPWCCCSLLLCLMGSSLRSAIPAIAVINEEHDSTHRFVEDYFSKDPSGDDRLEHRPLVADLPRT